jgi:hypothetical protein
VPSGAIMAGLCSFNFSFSQPGQMIYGCHPPSATRRCAVRCDWLANWVVHWRLSFCRGEEARHPKLHRLPHSLYLYSQGVVLPRGLGAGRPIPAGCALLCF